VSARTVRIGTRGSTLALWQAHWVAARLRNELPDHDFEVVRVATRGDDYAGPFTGAPGEIGFFTSEIEAALLEGHVDVAVHSLKDLPTSEDGMPPVVAVPLRDDPADVLVSRNGGRLAELPEGARVGTSSPRRTCLIRSLRPDVEVVPIRGNVDTRVQRVREGGFDAAVLAAAGLARLGLEGVVSERFDPQFFPPAPGQGALAVQARESSGALLDALRGIDDSTARRTTTAERVCLQALGGGCARPIGAHARWADDRLTLTGFVGAEDGGTLVRAQASGATADELGRAVAAELLRLGAGKLLA
jgi:hydroxymethylbilane synthase